MTNKEKKLHLVLTNLKPNTYIDKHPYWKRVKRGLLKMSANELDILWTLMICKNQAD